MKKISNKKLRLELHKETVAILGDAKLRHIAAGFEQSLSQKIPCSNIDCPVDAERDV